MAIEIVPLAAEHLGAMARFSRRVWQRPDDDAYYRWRYLDAPGLTTYVALLGGEVLATLSVFSRSYRAGTEQVECLETADWHCLPELRGSGIGIRMMQRVTAIGLPIFAVDGSETTRTLLPRLGWKTVGQATRFVRPLSLASLTRPLCAWLRLPPGRRRRSRYRLGRIEGWIGLHLLRSRACRLPRGAALRIGRFDGATAAICSGGEKCGTIPLPSRELVNWWLAAASPTRRFACLTLDLGGSPGGWGLVRADGPPGDFEATLIDLYTPDPRLYPCLVAELVACAARMGAHRIIALTACPELAAALKKNRFWERYEVPVQCWDAGRMFPAPYHLGSNIGDAPLWPYPTAWSGGTVGAER